MFSSLSLPFPPCPIRSRAGTDYNLYGGPTSSPNAPSWSPLEIENSSLSKGYFYSNQPSLEPPFIVLAIRVLLGRDGWAGDHPIRPAQVIHHGNGAERK